MSVSKPHLPLRLTFLKSFQVKMECKVRAIKFRTSEGGEHSYHSLCDATPCNDAVLAWAAICGRARCPVRFEQVGGEWMQYKFGWFLSVLKTHFLLSFLFGRSHRLRPKSLDGSDDGGGKTFLEEV